MSADADAIGLILLAAGESRRMGAPKQLLPFRGTTLLRHAAETALRARFAPVVVVLGCAEEACRATLANLDVVCVVNSNWSQGMGSSVGVGVAKLLELTPQIGGLAITLVDQPLITADDLTLLRASWMIGGKKVAAAAYGDVRGAPAIFAREYFTELLALEGGKGARSIILRHRDETAAVPIPSGAHDVDTPDAYDGIRGL